MCWTERLTVLAFFSFLNELLHDADINASHTQNWKIGKSRIFTILLTLPCVKIRKISQIFTT